MGKKSLLVAGVLVIAGLALALFLVLKIMLDPDALKPELEEQVKRLTGLQLELQGDISLKWYPWFGIELGPASLSSPEGFTEQLVSVKRLSVETKLVSLLQGKIDAKSLEIKGLDLNIVRNAKGRWNFQLLPVKEVTVHEDEVIVDTTKGDRYVFSYLIRGLELRDTSVTVIDALHGQRYAVSRCAVSAEDVKSGRPFDAEISFDGSSTQPRLSGSVQLRAMVSLFPETLRFAFNDVKLEADVQAQGLPFAKAGLALSLDSQIQAEQGLFELTRLAADAVVSGGIFSKEARAYLEGTGSLNLEQGLASAHLVHLNGLGLESEVTASATDVLQDPQLTAQVRTNTFDLKALLAACGIKPQWLSRIKGLTRCAYDGSVGLSKRSLSFDTSALRIDDSNLQLKASLDLPDVRGFDVAVSAPRFDICGVLPHEAEGGRVKGAAASAGAAGKPARPFSMHDYQGKLQLALNELVCGKESIGRLNVRASLAQGKLEVPELQLAMRHSSLSGAVHARFPKKGYEPDAGKAKLSLRSENLRNALASLGYAIGPTKDPKVWGKTRLDLEAAFNPEGYVLHAPGVELDGNKLSLSVLAAKPFPSRLTVDVKSGALDLNRYMSAKSPKSRQSRQSGDAKKSGEKKAASGESKKPFELPEIVRKSKCTASLFFKKLRYDLFSASNLQVKAVSDKGRVTVSSLQGKCFGGYITSSGSLDLRRTPAPLSSKLSAKGVNLQEFLAALGRPPHVTGRADIKADVSSRGFTSKEFFGGLNGKATALVVNGAILGLNLSSSALSSQQGIVGPKAKTLFQKANIKARAENGTVHFTQLNVRYPPNTISGTGTIVLPKNTISAQLNANLQGLPIIPITISGRLDKPDVGLDGAALVGNVVGGAANVVKDILLSPLTIEQGIQDGIESLFSSDKKK